MADRTTTGPPAGSAGEARDPYDPALPPTGCSESPSPTSRERVPGADNS